MARALKALRKNPTQVKEGEDDCIQVFHPAIFLGGATCSAKKLWLETRDVIGLDGITPLSNYDMTATGLGGVRRLESRWNSTTRPPQTSP
jgi:hypothetical protein